jgi:hypothetical protein
MDNARTRVPGALDTALQMELFNTLTEFFQQSDVWQEEIAVAVAPGGRTYDLSPADPGQINRLMGVVTAAGHPVRAAMGIPGTLVLASEPSNEETYTATVAMTVVDPVKTDGYPKFPDWVLTKYGLKLTDGVIGKMMSQQKKPYTNNQLAIFHLKKFQSAISQARTDSRHQNLFAAQRWRFPRTFAIGGK